MDPYINIRRVGSIVLLLLFLGGPHSLLAWQMPFYPRSAGWDRGGNAPVKDTLVAKRFIRSAWLWASMEILPWSFDRYVTKADYAFISWKTVGYNLHPGSWSWDNDGFVTNQLGHPSHGSLFFNAFRANGYNFWQSAAASFAGSYVWETFAENQAPSPNDFINTGFGGIVLGEMTNRFANKLIDNRRRGFKRQMSEVFAMMINPVNGLTRIMDGRWGKVSANAAERDSSRVYFGFDAGIREFRVDHLKDKFGPYAHLRLLYGAPYENYRVPFSNISINAEFGMDDSSKVNVVSVYGSLKGWRVASMENSRHLAIVSANYDFIYNEAFFYSAQSVKLNLFSEFTLPKTIKLNTIIGAGPILLAAVPNAYSYAGRNYDYCTGISFNGSGTISIADHFYGSINYRGSWLSTINGAASNYFLHTVSGEISYKIIDGLSVCAEPGYFVLQGNYRHYENVDKTYPFFRICIRYSLNIQ